MSQARVNNQYAYSVDKDGKKIHKYEIRKKAGEFNDNLPHFEVVRFRVDEKGVPEKTGVGEAYELVFPETSAEPSKNKKGGAYFVNSKKNKVMVFIYNQLPGQEGQVHFLYWGKNRNGKKRGLKIYSLISPEVGNGGENDGQERYHTDNIKYGQLMITDGGDELQTSHGSFKLLFLDDQDVRLNHADQIKGTCRFTFNTDKEDCHPPLEQDIREISPSQNLMPGEAKEFAADSKDDDVPASREQKQPQSGKAVGQRSTSSLLRMKPAGSEPVATPKQEAVSRQSTVMSRLYHSIFGHPIRSLLGLVLVGLFLFSPALLPGSIFTSVVLAFKAGIVSHVTLLGVTGANLMASILGSFLAFTAPKSVGNIIQFIGQRIIRGAAERSLVFIAKFPIWLVSFLGAAPRVLAEFLFLLPAFVVKMAGSMLNDLGTLAAGEDLPEVEGRESVKAKTSLPLSESLQSPAVSEKETVVKTEGKKFAKDYPAKRFAEVDPAIIFPAARKAAINGYGAFFNKMHKVLPLDNFDDYVDKHYGEKSTSSKNNFWRI